VVLHSRPLGDYGINHPDQVEDSTDPKFMRPTAHLRYATDNDWLIVKTRTIDSGGIDALPEHFRALMRRPEFKCVGASSAERWVDQVSKGSISPGNHHLAPAWHGAPPDGCYAAALQPGRCLS
jgi:hypothetical protein